jgi:hypothetical protein
MWVRRPGRGNANTKSTFTTLLGCSRARARARCSSPSNIVFAVPARRLTHNQAGDEQLELRAQPAEEAAEVGDGHVASSRKKR